MLAQLIAYSEQYGLDYVYVVSTNLYGENDNFNIQSGHVIPSLICKFYEATFSNSEIFVWGDGSTVRDFLYSKDLARALCLIMKNASGAINVGSGVKTTIREIVQILAQYFRMEKHVSWDFFKPQGRAFCEIDLQRIRSVGFFPEYSIEQGLQKTLNWFVSQYEKKLVRGYS